uniref:Uncharacterized protein n=1 Tax=Rhizophora mucronata TaxID=61149 RepID=A0A2P2PZH7_RHIMU
MWVACKQRVLFGVRKASSVQ